MQSHPHTLGLSGLTALFRNSSGPNRFSNTLPLLLFQSAAPRTSQPVEGCGLGMHDALFDANRSPHVRSHLVS